MKNKKILSIVLAISMILVLGEPMLVKATESKSVVTITADPGHGPGNQNKGPTDYYEHEGMWKLANYLKEELENNGVKVVLTRTENEDPSLDERGSKAKGSDLFISLHSNASEFQEASGVEVFYSIQQPENEQYARRLAEVTSNVMGTNNRGAKTLESKDYPGQDLFGVIRSAVAAGCPHVYLVENGFHTNPKEEEWLKNDNNLKKLAEAQAKVIMEILNFEPEEGLKDEIDESEEVDQIEEDNSQELKPDEEGGLEEEDSKEEDSEEIEANEEDESEEVAPKEEDIEEKTILSEEDEELNLAIKEAEEAIANLPEVNEVTLEHNHAISYAKKLVQAVRELDKNVVIYGEEKIAILEAKIAELIEDQEVVNRFVEQINRLPRIDEITLENIEEIKLARTAYNNLTEAQKQLVSEEVLGKLITAEEKINDLLKAKEKAKKEEVKDETIDEKLEDNKTENKTLSTKEEKETLPKTGNEIDRIFYISGISLILLGLSIRRRIS